MKIYIFRRESRSNFHTNLRDSYILYYSSDLQKIFGIATRNVFSTPELFVSDEKEIIDDLKHVLLNQNSKEFYNEHTKYSVFFEKEVEADDNTINQLIKSIEQMHKYKQLVTTLFSSFTSKVEVYECTIFKIFNKTINNYIWSATAKRGKDISSVIKFPDCLTEDEAVSNVKKEMKNRNIKEYDIKIEQLFQERQIP